MCSNLMVTPSADWPPYNPALAWPVQPCYVAGLIILSWRHRHQSVRMCLRPQLCHVVRPRPCCRDLTMASLAAVTIRVNNHTKCVCRWLIYFHMGKSGDSNQIWFSPRLLLKAYLKYYYVSDGACCFVCSFFIFINFLLSMSPIFKKIRVIAIACPLKTDEPKNG